MLEEFGLGLDDVVFQVVFDRFLVVFVWLFEGFKSGFGFEKVGMTWHPVIVSNIIKLYLWLCTFLPFINIYIYIYYCSWF